MPEVESQAAGTAAAGPDALDAAWAAFVRLARSPRADGHPATRIRPLFDADPDRFARFHRRAGDLLLDLSKTALTDPALAAGLALAQAAGLEAQRDAMARGEPVNATERRPALHLALRAPRAAGYRARAGGPADGPGAGPAEDASATVHATLDRMQAFCAAVHGGTATAADGGRFTDVLNIGIGGSDLGPAMVARALWTPACPLRPHFLANVDGHAWEGVRAGLDPRRTLVLVASKTFTTQETMANAGLVRAWLVRALGEAGAARHLAALSTNLPATAAFGIPPERVFPFRDWVGGRFSLWSAIGLSVALALGWDRFARLLAGAHALDTHFLTAAPADNLPVLLALTEAWHVAGMGLPARAVLPYDERLALLPAHLQQLEMESLGKRVRRDGTPLAAAAAADEAEAAAPRAAADLPPRAAGDLPPRAAGDLLPRAAGAIVFGAPGTSAQHSFLQWLHQAPAPVPAEFILVATPDHPHAASHRMLLANGLAQAEALLLGRDAGAAAAAMAAAGVPAAEIARLAPHRVFPGDRPSVTLLLPRLDPYTLGQLIALYEHKVFCLAALAGVNAFDQWGVELGKERATRLLPALAPGAVLESAPESATADGVGAGGVGAGGTGWDASTAGLLAAIRALAADPSG